MHVFLDSLSLLYSGGYFRGFGSRAFASVPSECLRFPTHLGCTIRRPWPGEVAPFLVLPVPLCPSLCQLILDLHRSAAYMPQQPQHMSPKGFFLLFYPFKLVLGLFFPSTKTTRFYDFTHSQNC